MSVEGDQATIVICEQRNHDFHARLLNELGLAKVVRCSQRVQEGFCRSALKEVSGAPEFSDILVNQREGALMFVFEGDDAADHGYRFGKEVLRQVEGRNRRLSMDVARRDFSISIATGEILRHPEDGLFGGASVEVGTIARKVGVGCILMNLDTYVSLSQKNRNEVAPTYKNADEKIAVYCPSRADAEPSKRWARLGEFLWRRREEILRIAKVVSTWLP